MKIGKYKHLDVYDEMPTGWHVDKTCGSPMSRSVIISDGVSPINGGKHAILKAKIKEYIEVEEIIPQEKPIIKQEKVIDKNYTFPAKSVNDLARKKFEEHLFKEIMFDLMVCEIENWDKTEYIKELKKLINSVKTNIKITRNLQQDLFNKIDIS